MTAMQNKHCDVLIIGGGPAGTTTASYLAKLGWQVVLLEKDSHPRFHIGESLLPHTLPILDELGVLKEVSEIGMPKYGVEFCCQEISQTRKLYFADALDKRHPLAFQVKRAEFDEILFQHCQKQGVVSHQLTEVTAVDDDGDGHVVTAKQQDGAELQWHCRFVVDATGRDTFFANKTRSKVKNRHHATAAIFTHFDKVPQLAGKNAGHISVYWFEYGWFWLIPFQDGSASVGAVCQPSYLKTRQSSLEEFFQQTTQLNPQLAERLQSSSASMPVTATGNYSYFNENIAGQNWLTVGDACAFVDPVFSSGVHLAMHSAKVAAQTIDKIFKQPRNTTKYLTQYEATVKRGLSQFSWLIYRMTKPAIIDMFMNPRNVFRVQEAVMSLLAGDVYHNNLAKRRLTLFKIIYYLKSLTLRKKQGSAHG